MTLVVLHMSAISTILGVLYSCYAGAPSTEARGACRPQGGCGKGEGGQGHRDKIEIMILVDISVSEQIMI